MPGLTRQFSSVYTLSAVLDATKCRSSPSSRPRARYVDKGDGFVVDCPHVFWGSPESIPMRPDVANQLPIRRLYTCLTVTFLHSRKRRGIALD